MGSTHEGAQLRLGFGGQPIHRMSRDLLQAVPQLQIGPHYAAVLLGEEELGGQLVVVLAVSPICSRAFAWTPDRGGGRWCNHVSESFGKIHPSISVGRCSASVPWRR